MHNPGISDQGSQSQITNSPSDFAVEARTLQSILLQHGIGRPDLLMIDTEGAELPILQGLNLKHHRPDVLLCEIHPNEWPHFGYTADSFRAFLDAEDLMCLDTYLRERRDFEAQAYIGPCLLVRRTRGHTAE